MLRCLEKDGFGERFFFIFLAQLKIILYFCADSLNIKAMTQKCFFSLLLLTIGTLSYAQSPDRVDFSYDINGNMSDRSVALIDTSPPSGGDDSKPLPPQPVEPVAPTDTTTKDSITVYPNPTDGTLFINTPSPKFKEQNVIRLFDPTGKLIQTQDIKSDHTELPINAPAGIYLLDIRLGDRRSEWKILKK